VEIICKTRNRERIIGDQPLQGVFVLPNNNDDESIKLEKLGE